MPLPGIASLPYHMRRQGAEPNALVPSGRGAGEMTGMKLLSASVLWLQALLFALGTAYVVWGFIRVVEAGAWFVPGFESIELRRLIATLAPYLVLPVGIISFILALQKWKVRNRSVFSISSGGPRRRCGTAILDGRA